MNQVSVFVKHYFRYLFYFLLAINLLVSNKLHEHSGMLVNRHSPNGIISLELNFGQAAQDSILTNWDSTKKGFMILGTACSETNQTLTATEVAVNQNNWDYLFIVSYTLFFLCFCLRLFPFRRPSLRLSLVISAILLVGLLDLIENIFISVALGNHSAPAWHIWIPSLVKWFVLALLCTYLLVQMFVQGIFRNAFQDFSGYISGTLKLIWSFRIAFICLLILFLALWGMDQGRDLLLIINSSALGPTALLISVSILALLNWYLPKIYIPNAVTGISFLKFISGKWAVPRSMVKNEFDGARLMGSLSFLIPMICILNAMRIFGIPYLFQGINPFFLLLVILGFYQLALYNNWINRWFAPEGIVNKKRFLILVGLVLVFIFSILLFESHVKPFFLAYLAIDLFLLSLVFLVYTTIRTCNWGNLNLKVYNITFFVVLPGMLLFVIFLLANIYPGLFYFSNNLRLLTLPIIISALCFYNILFTFILLKGATLKIQFISLLLLAGLIISTVKENSFHQLRRIPTENNFSTADSLPPYIKAWLIKRKPEIDSFHLATRDSFPVFIINAYGGGIRAAAWTTLVISHLDSLLSKRGGRPFQHYVLAYSGASGGTIGLSELCAARYCLPVSPSPEKWKDLYGNDYLTPLIIGLLGRDAWSSSFGFNIYPDRSVLQEDVWEKRLLQQKISYDSPFVKYWDSGGVNGQYEVPLLFANSYMVDSGLKAIVAPVRLSHRNFPGTIFIEDLLEKDKQNGIKLSTGAFLSARFPLISPSGKIDQTHHFMDGGLKENSGAETSKEILAVLNRVLRQLGKSDSSFARVKIILLSLPNTIRGTDSLQTVANFYELTAPFTALENNWVGNTNKADTINARDTAGYIHYNYYQLRPSALCVENFKPVLPLGWQISDYALGQMINSLDSTKPSLQYIAEMVRHPQK